VQWKNLKSGFLGTAVYTASWAAPTADVHSQQRFHFMAHKGTSLIGVGRLVHFIAPRGMAAVFFFTFWSDPLSLAC
jgi:hypothetical protein